MTLMTFNQVRKYSRLAAIIGILAGCSATGDPASSSLFDRISALTGLKSPVTPVSRQDFSDVKPGDILLVQLGARKDAVVMRKAYRSAHRVVWRSPERVTASFDQGILIGTRGLGNDLMGADISGLQAAFDNKGGQVTRIHGYLGHEDDVTLHTLSCEVRFEGPDQFETVAGKRSGDHFTEDCKDESLVFKNEYWLKKERIIRSFQVVSTDVGFIKADQF